MRLFRIPLETGIPPQLIAWREMDLWGMNEHETIELFNSLPENFRKALISYLSTTESSLSGALEKLEIDKVTKKIKTLPFYKIPRKVRKIKSLPLQGRSKMVKWREASDFDRARTLRQLQPPERQKLLA